MVAPDSPSPQHPLQPEELELVTQVSEALRHDRSEGAAYSIQAIEAQLQSLTLFGELLRRYPSPLQEQSLGGKRRGLETLVDSLVSTDQATFPFRAPTQALVGRAMNMAHINFLRMLWHLAGGLADAVVAGGAEAPLFRPLLEQFQADGDEKRLVGAADGPLFGSCKATIVASQSIQ